MAESGTFDYESKDFSSSGGSLMNIDKYYNKSPKPGLIRDIIQTENDLVGFNIAWIVGFLIIIVLRIIRHEDVKDARWWWIFLIPIAICCLTWMFSYIITKYRRDHSKESMKIPAFMLPFFCKIFIASLLFWRLFYSSGGIMDRYQYTDKYNGWCSCSMFVIWISLILSVITTEIIITTVMVNSSQNLRAKIPKKVDIFLFITRPLLWVYNRLIVLFLTFYCYFYVFGIGPLCTSQCKVNDVSRVSSIGISILILPFRNILYLFKWESFNLNQQSDSKEVVYAVIQQVLIFTTILDLLMDIWSVSQIFKRIEMDTIRVRLTGSIKGYKHPKVSNEQNIKSTEKMPVINEDDDDMEAELAKLDTIKVGHGHDNIKTKNENELPESNELPKYSTLSSSSVANYGTDNDPNVRINAKHID